jgi:hypothetical protein
MRAEASLSRAAEYLVGIRNDAFQVRLADDQFVFVESSFNALSPALCSSRYLKNA